MAPALMVALWTKVLISSVVMPGFTSSPARARISAERTLASRISAISRSVLILMAIPVNVESARGIGTPAPEPRFSGCASPCLNYLPHRDADVLHGANGSDHPSTHSKVRGRGRESESIGISGSLATIYDACELARY